jgi:hypothetical protein
MVDLALFPTKSPSRVPCSSKITSDPLFLLTSSLVNNCRIGSLLPLYCVAIVTELTMVSIRKASVASKHAGEPDRHNALEIADEDTLAQLGYRQDLNRDWSLLQNFGVSFSIIVRLYDCTI